jgi:hypothetical protein
VACPHWSRQATPDTGPAAPIQAAPRPLQAAVRSAHRRTRTRRSFRSLSPVARHARPSGARGWRGARSPSWLMSSTTPFRTRWQTVRVVGRTTEGDGRDVHVLGAPQHDLGSSPPHDRPRSSSDDREELSVTAWASVRCRRRPRGARR